MPESTLQPLTAKLIPWAVGAILTLVGTLGAALAAMYQWVFKRQIERLDDVDKRVSSVIEFASDLDKSQEILAMQMTVVQQNADTQRKEHKEAIDNLHIATDRKIEASDRRHERAMDLLSGYFEKLLEQGTRRRETD